MVEAREENGLETEAELSAELPEEAQMPFYQRPFWKTTFIGVVLIGLWVALGMIFTSEYLRF